MRVVIDRFEGDYAICETENRQMINIRKNDIPFNAKEGDVLKINIEFDREETMRRKEEAEKLSDDLWK